MNFDEMMTAFRECFKGYGEETFTHPEGAKWIYALSCPRKTKDDDSLSGFHYELIARGAGGGEEYYVELHFELYKHQHCNLRSALISKFAEAENRRKILATSYYSSLMWRVRTPVLKVEQIAKDLDLLRMPVEEVLQNFDKTDDSINVAIQSAAEDELVLPCHIPIAKVADMLSEGYKTPLQLDKNCLTIPPVQRGKVWNAARIETLWDSIFRGFPIGALSVWHCKDRPHTYELLDGQQRTTAIALGFESFPDSADERKFDSILWIDFGAIAEDAEPQYKFFVTTASQPWGYAESSSETRNSLLSASERRNAANKLTEWEDGQIKPYPFQLYPVKAKLPVPYTLLRQFAQENSNGSYGGFRTWLESRNKKFLFLETLKNFIPTEKAEERFRQLCKKVSDISNDYSVFLLDASSVTENDIALYFTRIGKGGVVPSDEELAYSVLKSKLTQAFRTVIQTIHEKYGLASESRIAHLAIRLFKSESDQKDSGKQHFDSGAALSAVMGMCKEENTRKKQEFLDFVTNDFGARVEKVDKTYALTQWHLARYASERNGDVFLLLLLAAGNEELLGKYNVNGLAELLFGYATHVDYAVRKIFEQGVPIAIANLTKETYYGKPRLTLPIAPEKLDCIPNDSIEALLKWKNGNPEVACSIAEGYYNSDYNHAYNILLYACRRSKLNNQFKYDPNLGLWSEENLPWDYDHIMPHSTIEKMPDSDAKSVCEWLKNSMGNLAPLPFSLNRSWSDAARNENYPCGDPDGRVSLCIDRDGTSISSMWDSDGQIFPLKFSMNTITRYGRIYRHWFDDLGIGRILNFSDALDEKTTHNSEIWDAAKHRYSAFSKVLSLLSGMNFTYKRIIADNKEQEIHDDELCREFCADQVITLSRDVNGVAVALSKCGIRGAWEIGLRKRSVDSATTKRTHEKVKMMLPLSNIDNSRLCKEGERWWYWYEELPDRIAGIELKLSERLHALMGFADKLLECDK